MPLKNGLPQIVFLRKTIRHATLPCVNTTTLLGAHVSASGGFCNAFLNADAIGAQTIQFFGASPRQWFAPMPNEKSIADFKAARKNSNVQSVFLHAAYLVNLGSDKADLRAKSIASLTAHLRIAQLLEADGLIFHMGSNSNRKQGLAYTAEGMQAVLQAVPGETRLIMENSSGGGSKLCYDVDEIGEVFHAVNNPRVKVCLDTAHIFAAGVIPHFSQTNIEFTLNRWEKFFGLSNIVAVHFNDSKTLANSHTDRHENIGDGHIGLEGLKNFAAQKSLYHASWILEVPGLLGEGPDQENLERLQSLFGRLK